MTKTALLALLAIWGVGLGTSLPARAEDALAEGSASEAKMGAAQPADGFVNRVWQRQDKGDLPGVIRVFLSDGTLIQDSCWETHRLSSWQMHGKDKLSWDEDGMDIKAHIASLSGDKLTLVLDLKGGAVEEHYAAAPVPYICPDMPKA
jgi:hypothetical protein